MKRFTPIAGAAAAAALAIPAGALAAAPTAQHARSYERLYQQAVKQLGDRAPGRNIVKSGFSPGHPATDTEVVASITVLERMIQAAVTPAPVKHAAAAAPQTSSATTSTTGSTGGSTGSTATSSATPTASSAGGSAAGAGGVPACASESGTNYSTGSANTNSSTGATGRYQIEPATAAGYGCNLSTPAGQDACAQVIYAHQGASAWVGCGG